MPPNHISNQLFHHLRGAGRASDVYLQRELKEIGLPLAQFYILSCLWQRDGVTQNFIGEKTFMTEGVTSQLIKEMVKQDLVEQRRDPSDKRKRLIYLRPSAEALKGPALEIWVRCLQDVSDGLGAEDLAVFSTLADRMRLNALTAYQKEFGGQGKVRGETLNLIKALTLNSEESLSVINSDLKFVYMNDRFRTFFDMPESALSVGDPAQKFYRRLAGMPRYKIENPEKYVFERIQELKNLRTKRSIVRRSGNGHYFRITQTKLEDGSILTNTERLSNEIEAQEEMQACKENGSGNSGKIEIFRSEAVQNIAAPLKAIANTAETLREVAPGQTAQSKAAAINEALSNCVQHVEKIVKEL